VSLKKAWPAFGSTIAWYWTPAVFSASSICGQPSVTRVSSPP